MEKHKFDKRKLDECDDNVETCEWALEAEFLSASCNSQHRVDELIINYMW